MKKYRHKIYTRNIAVTCEMVNDNYEIVKGGIIHRVPNWIIENSQDWELIPNVEVRKVYKATNTKLLILVKENSESKTKAIGFQNSGDWFELSSIGTNNLTEATKDEWLERLKEEAIKRGLVKGVKFKSDYSDNVYIIDDYNIEAWFGFYTKNTCLMDSDTGKWATVIEEKKPIFISHDGEEMFENDLYYVPQADFNGNLLGTYIQFKTDIATKNNTVIKFSTEQKAIDYISINLKKPILTTHDGVDLLELDKCYSVDVNSKDEIVGSYSILNARKHIGGLIFSTPEKAQEYIDNNQKRYSLEDIRKANDNGYNVPIGMLIDELKKQTK